MIKCKVMQGNKDLYYASTHYVHSYSFFFKHFITQLHFYICLEVKLYKLRIVIKYTIFIIIIVK